MDHKELREAVCSRPLSLSELLKQAFAILNDRFGSIFLLTVLVYLPVNLILELKMQQVDLTVEDLELLVSQMLGVEAVQVLLSFVELVAIVVTAVMVHNYIFGTKRAPFGRIFYRGIRMWLRAAVTMIILLLGVVLCIMSLSMLSILPVLMLAVMPVLLLLMIFYSLMQCSVAAAASLRGYWGMNCIRYVSFILKGYMKKAIGNTAVILLITGGVSMLFNMLLSGILSYIASPWLYIGISTVFSTLISVLSIYGFAAGCLLFLNLEEYKRYQMEEAQKTQEDRNV